jgi:hypothetical protein
MNFGEQVQHCRWIHRTIGFTAAGKEIDREWPITQGADPCDRLRDFRRRHVGRTKRSQPTRIGDGRHQLGTARSAGHRRKDDGVLNP